LILRTLGLMGCLIALAPIAGAERVTVEQLKQKLSAPLPPIEQSSVPVALLQDARMATRLDNLQLTERLTPATMESITAQFKFGIKSKQSLQLLADRSALLEPPASELPDQLPPGADQQKQMLDATRTFVFKTLMRLPNFFATRTTYRFLGIPVELNQTGFPVYVGLHLRGSYSREVTYRNGKEVLDPMKASSTDASPSHQGVARWTQSGFETWGEFGPEPVVILMDAENGTMGFHHWERGAQGLVAVFRFSVAAEDSHFEVNYACNYSNSFHAQPAYHGSLAIDPVSGAIMRIALEAESKPDDPISHVASVIEYGPVEIGGRTYICPVRSLAFSVEDSDACAVPGHNRRQVQPMLLNRTTFTDYHRLGSTARIIADPAEVKESQQKPGPQR